MKQQDVIAKELELQTAIKSAQMLVTGGVEKAAVVVIDGESDSDEDIFVKRAGGAGAGAGAGGAAPASGAATTGRVGAAPAQAQAVRPVVAASQLGVPRPWTRYMDPSSGKFFYNNAVTNKSQWHQPS